FVWGNGIRNARQSLAKGPQRTFDKSCSAENCPAVRISLGNLCWRKRRLANPGRNGIQFNTQVRNHPIQFAEKIIAADDARVGQFRDRFCQTFLERLQPEGARPRRTRSVQLMENCDEFTALLSPQLLQDRQQAKRNTALLETVVHVMEQEMIVILDLLH